MKKMEESKLRKIYSALFDERSQMTMTILHRTWFRNILYYMGEQWFEWVRGQNTFRRIVPNSFTPTPVSNLIRDYVRSMKSLMLNKDYAVTIWPNSNDQEDRDAAEMGESLLRWLETFSDERHLDEKEKLAIWMVLAGTSFDRTTINTEDDGWIYDKAGDPITTGNICSTCVNPFSVRLDTFGDALRQKRYIGLQTLRPREWVEDTFKVKVTSDGDKMLVDYERKLAALVASVSPWKGDGLEQITEIPDEDMVLLKEVEKRPCKDYPRGHYSGMVGDKVVFEYDRMPIPAGKDGSWDYSLTDFHYHFTPGRFWSDSGVNDLISPQNTINEIDQDLAVNRKGVGKPMILMPTDMNMKRVSRFGQTVIVLQYDALLAGGAKPEIGRGTPLPGQVLDERAIHMQSAQDAAGDPRNVLRGKSPSQNASGVMVDILRDAAEQGHLPDVERFYRAYKRVKRKQLLLAQEAYTEERLIKIPDRGGAAKVMKFRGADLRNNTDVRIELASGVASTRAGQANLLLKLVGDGFFNVDSPVDPEFRMDILKRIGLGGFRDRSSADLARARAENEKCGNYKEDDSLKIIAYDETDPETGEVSRVEIGVVEGLFAGLWMPGMVEPIVIEDDPTFEFDNDDIHYEAHRRFIVSPEFSALPQPVRDAMITHAKSHDSKRKAKLKAEQDEAMQRAAEFEAQAAAEKGAAQAGGDVPQDVTNVGGAVPGPMSMG